MRRIIRDPVCSRYLSGHALSNFNIDEDPAAD